MFLDVWPISLCPDTPAAEDESVLSAEERQRAARFHFAKHAVRYRVCHAKMRQILSRYLEIPASQVELTHRSTGKPLLADDSDLRFNLSHSGDLALLAVTTGMEVGVDVEAIRDDLSVDGLARFFTAAERDSLTAMSPHERVRTFFQWWTRKEAVLKADGSGLSGGLDRLDISECPPGLVHFPADGEQWWRVADLDVEPGYTAAVAGPPGEWRVRWRRLNDIGSEIGV